VEKQRKNVEARAPVVSVVRITSLCRQGPGRDAGEKMDSIGELGRQGSKSRRGEESVTG